VQYLPYSVVGSSFTFKYYIRVEETDVDKCTNLEWPKIFICRYRKDNYELL